MPLPFGLAGGISPHQIIDDGDSAKRPAPQNRAVNSPRDQPAPK